MGTLSIAELRIIEFYTLIACSLGVISGTWDKCDKKLQISNSNRQNRIRRLIYWAYLCGCVFWTTASGLRIHNAFILNPEQFHILLKMVYIFLLIIPLFSILSLWPFGCFKEHLSTVLNQLLEISHKFGESNKRPRHKLIIISNDLTLML